MSGVMGLEQLRKNGYLENVKIYTCPSTTDVTTDGNDLATGTVSYGFIGALTESNAVDSAIAADHIAKSPSNHTKYGNVLFADGHVAGFAGASWCTGTNIGYTPAPACTLD